MFCAMIILMISNRIMGVYRVGIAYILLGGLGFIMLTAGMILVRFDYIFKKEKPKRVARRTTENPKQKLKHTQKHTKKKPQTRNILDIVYKNQLCEYKIPLNLKFNGIFFY